MKKLLRPQAFKDITNSRPPASWLLQKTLMKDFENFISEWTEANPQGTRTLAAAVIYAYFTASSEETRERLLSLDVTPDALDLNDVLIDAIRSTNLTDSLEDIIGKKSAIYS